MKTRFIAFTVAVFICIAAFGTTVANSTPSKVSCADIDKKIQDALKDRWTKLQKPSSFWGMKISPPIPLLWPSSKGGEVKFIAYAMAFDPSISDGSRIGSPWAVITVDPADPSKMDVNQIVERFKDIGIQGVRPLMPEETNIVKKGFDAEDALLMAIAGKKALSGDSMRDVKAYYCLFKKTNGVIYNELTQYGADFFKSLSCGK